MLAKIDCHRSRRGCSLLTLAEQKATEEDVETDANLFQCQAPKRRICLE